MRPVISDNTAVKLILTSTCQDDIEQLRGYSEDIERTRDGGKNFTGLNASSQTRGVYEPRLERNEILHASAVAGEGFLVVNDGVAHREPKRIRFDPIYFKDTFTPDAHAKLSSIPLPRREEPKDEAKPVSVTRESKNAISLERKARHEKLRAIIAECQTEERWES